MSKISKMKKAIKIFRSYGIPLSGKRKAANLFNELHMDKILVNWLIFELELELQKEIDSLSGFNSPSDILKALFVE